MNINPNMFMQFMQFSNQFRGNPQQAVMNLLQSGQVTPQQYQNAQQMAQQMMSMFNPNARGF